MLRQGKRLADARCGGTSGCVETGAFGKENYNLTGYFNMPKVLELALHNGIDPRTGKQLGPQTGDPRSFAAFDDLFAAFERQLLYFIDVKVRGNAVIERLYARSMPVPFLSLLIDDCIARGRDYHDGGARYNTSYIQGVGLGTMADALSAIKFHVYDQKTLTMEALLEALEADFGGHERIQQLLLNRTPRYGNDDDYADALMMRVFEAYYRAVDGRPNTKGGQYHIDLLPTTPRLLQSVTGATPDGREAGRPLSEGISPVQGLTVRARRQSSVGGQNGPGADGRHTPEPETNAAPAGGRCRAGELRATVRTYFMLDGHHIQFNVVDAATLRKAQADPEAYRDLIRWVAGYSDYFCDLSQALQDEIIARTEHEVF